MNYTPKPNTLRWLSGIVVPLFITLGIMISGHRDEWREPGFFVRFGIVYLITLVTYNLIGIVLGKILKKPFKA